MLPDEVTALPSPVRLGFCLRHPDDTVTLYADPGRPESLPHEAAEALYWTGLARVLLASGAPTAKIQRWREEAFCNQFADAYVKERERLITGR